MTPYEPRVYPVTYRYFHKKDALRWFIGESGWVHYYGAQALVLNTHHYCACVMRTIRGGYRIHVLVNMSAGSKPLPTEFKRLRDAKATVLALLALQGP
jgi:hypothetical protein